ncbi:MAG: carboxypeptidase-like regulatory domain-containing protein [Acidobacteriota bacterium]|nr:carboxypeptidase-like regulatory domain-containing protein [Acidobacteriota bacterium]
MSRVFALGLLLGVLGAAPLHAQQAVVLYSEAPPQLWKLQELSQPALAGAEAVWAWAPGAAPRRFGPEELPGFLSDLAKNQRLQPTEGRLTVSVDLSKAPRRVRGREASGDGPEGLDLRLIAAPAAMWGEVPEALLPSWPVPPPPADVEEGARMTRSRIALAHAADQSWRLRLVGAGLGSWWREVSPGQERVELAASRAEERSTVLVGPEGEAATGGLTVLAEERGRQRVVAQYRSEETGATVLPALPEEHELTLVVSAPGYASRALSVWPSALPPKLRLGLGASLAARVVDPEGEPVVGASVEAEAWLDPSSSAFAARRAVSGEDGRFILESLPRAETVLAIRHPDFAERRETRVLEGPRLDLGHLELVPVRTLAVRVVDDEEVPVAGATVQPAAGPAVITGPRGRALLSVAVRGGLTVSVDAPGHLSVQQRLEPFREPEPRVVLQRAFQVEGRLVDSSGGMVSEGTLRVRTGRSYDEEALDGEGRFRLDLAPDKEVLLILRSPSTREVRVSVQPGAAGEARDLGDLMAPPGMTVRGRLIRDEDGSAVAGARVWTPRPTEEGDVLAWYHGDLVSATSDEAGAFTLTGLPPRQVLLRFEAAGLARAHRRVEPPAEGDGVDLGEIPLFAGSALLVLVDEKNEASDLAQAVARVDLLGRWQELDMLTATVVDGEALVRRVPPGRALVTVVRGRDLLCERRVEVERGAEVQEVECRRESSWVSGRVLRGGEAVSQGRLSWLPPPSTAPALILNRSTPLGASRQQVFGGGRPQVDVEVDAGGYFATDSLSPGSWEVLYLSDAGAVTAPKTVTLADVPQQEIEVRFPAAAITGMVVDEEGAAVAGARVEELSSRAFTLSRADGRFELEGLGPGSHRLFARLGERRSAVVDVEVNPVEAPEPVMLELREREEDRVEISVLDDGAVVVGAFLVLEGDAGVQQLTMTGRDGRGVVQLTPPLPSRVRAAAMADGRWVLGPWVELEQARREGVVLALGAVGAVELLSGEAQGIPFIVSTDGWDLTGLLARLGTPPTLRPGQPLTVSGLPEGSYRIMLGDFQATATVQAGDSDVVELP